MYITKIRLERVRCFNDVEIDLTSDGDVKKWLVIVGNNGVGKTTLLSSIAMGICDETGSASLLQDTSGEWIRQGENTATIEIQLVDNEKPYTIKTTITKKDDLEVLEQNIEPTKDFPWKRIFACSYGANRSIEGRSVRERYASADALYTLFNYEYSLLNPELMLRRRAKTDKEVKEICYWLDDILLLDKGSVNLTDSGIAIKTSGFNIHWGSIADGYEVTITMILDMLGWAMLAGKTEEKNTLEGIMLIDELEQHFHPELQRHIVKKLHDNFPNLQFIASSHSPICAAGLADLPDEQCSLELLTSCDEGPGTNESLSTMRGWRYDQVLTSDAFGIPDRNAETEKLMNKIRELYMKEKELTKKEATKLKQLLGKLKEESPVGAEEEGMMMTKEEMRRIKRDIEDNKSD